MTEKKQQTMNNIIQTAYSLFKEKTYQKTTINDICAKAGLTKRAFYYHFNSKEDLLATYYNNLYEISSDVDILKSTQFKTEWDRIWHIYEVKIDETIETGYDILGEILKLTIQDNKGTFDQRAEFNDLIIPIVKKAQEKGEIRNQSDPLTLSLCSQDLILGIANRWCASKGSFDEKAEIKRGFETLYDVRLDLRTY